MPQPDEPLCHACNSGFCQHQTVYQSFWHLILPAILYINGICCKKCFQICNKAVCNSLQNLIFLAVSRFRRTISASLAFLQEFRAFHSFISPPSGKLYLCHSLRDKCPWVLSGTRSGSERSSHCQSGNIRMFSKKRS